MKYSFFDKKSRCLLDFGSCVYGVRENKSDKSQEQAKHGANFLALNVNSCCSFIGEGVIKENYWGVL